ncbi:hypothetical protein [Curtobacterium sp. MCBD17_040]|uniref:hypothetical protein n=1 Tax=Curtobacterium sp. MCBD17_040 TaxID=2175674 RepID=UPI000DA89AB7|nr:hypothetical protein [Curtobacterium sp. MCBD17_040]WIB64367.1 hypothetical protein DEI94_04000 [Curtobacterium sp. MCBD17_040]
MANGINISIGADTRKFVSQVKEMPDALQQTIEALEKFKAEGGEAPDALIDRLKEAQAQTRDLSKQIDGVDKSLSKVNSGSGGGSSSVFKETGKAAEEMGERTEEGSKVGEAALMNLGFSAGTVGEAFTGPSGLISQVGMFAAFLGPELGPLAVPITLLGVALAAVGSSMEDDTDDASKLKDSVKSLTDQFIDSGDKTKSTASQYNAALKAILDGSTDLGISQAEIRKATELTGQSQSAFYRAMADTSKPAIDAQIKATRDYVQTMKSQIETDGGAARSINSKAAAEKGLTAAQQGRMVKDQSELDSAKKLLSAEKEHADALDKATKNTKLNASAQEESAGKTNQLTAAEQAQKQAVKDAADATQGFSDSLHGALQAAGEDTDDFTKNGVTNLAKYVKNLNSTTQSIISEAANLSSVAPGLTQAGLDYVESLGQQAAPLLAQAVKLGPSNPQYQALLNSWNAAGQASETKFSSAVKAGKQPVVTPDVDSSKADRKLDNLKSQRPNGPTFQSQVDTNQVENRIQEMGRRSVNGPTLNFRSNTYALDRAIASYQNKVITVPVEGSLSINGKRVY